MSMPGTHNLDVPGRGLAASCPNITGLKLGSVNWHGHGSGGSVGAALPAFGARSCCRPKGRAVPSSSHSGVEAVPGAGGLSSSFDLAVHMKSGDSIEFRSLPKGELHAVLGYIATSGVIVKTEGSDSEPQEESDSDSSEVSLSQVEGALWKQPLQRRLWRHSRRWRPWMLGPCSAPVGGVAGL